MDETEVTPAKSQSQWELVFDELTELKVICQRSADNSFNTNEALKGLVSRVERVEKRQDSRDVAWVWAPLIMSSLAFCGMLWLAFNFGHH